MGAQAPDAALAVVEEGVGLDGEDALAALLVGQRVPQHQWPQRPRRALVALFGRALVDVELVDRGRSLAVGRAQAVGPRVASADDDDLLAGGVDGRPGEQAGLHPIGGDEVVHGQVDAVEVPPRDVEVPLPQGADGQDHGVVARPQVLDGQVDADVDAALEDGALGLHLVDPAVQEGLVHLEVGDAVADEAAGAVIALVDDDLVTGPGQLLGGRHPRRPRAHHGDELARVHAGAQRRHPTVLPAVVDDLLLDRLYGHGLVVYGQHAGALARCRAHPARELGEVVGGVQAFDGVAPAVPENEVVPVRYEVAERAARQAVTKRDGAVHAARRLGPERGAVHGLVHLAPVPHPQMDGAVLGLLALVLQEAVRVSHAPKPSPGPRRPG